MDISVVIPVYNEVDNIPLIHQRLVNILSNLVTTFEVIFVNDGSKDDSLAVIKGLADRFPEVKYVDFSRNFGHQVAVSAGIDHASGEAIVIIDADLQDPPELIESLYARLREGYDVAYAQRTIRKGETWLKRRTASLFYRLFARMTTVPIPLDTGDFRIIHRRVAEVLRQMPERHKFLRGQISWIGFRQIAVPYVREERHAGVSGYSYWKLFKLALDGVTGFSDLPLRMAYYLGFSVSGLAFLAALRVLWLRYVLGEFVSDSSSMMIAILFLGGVQLVAIGIVGEYLGRMNDNVRQRPLYIVRESNTISR